MFCIIQLFKVLTVGVMQSTIIIVIASVAAKFSQGHATWPGAPLNNDKKKSK